jgi:hypothetical protein
MLYGPRGRRSRIGGLHSVVRPKVGSDDNFFDPVAGGHSIHNRFDAQASNSALSANPALLRGALFGLLLALSGVELAWIYMKGCIPPV